MGAKKLADTSPLRQLLDRGIDALIERARRDPYEHLPGYMERYWLLRPRSLLPFAGRTALGRRYTVGIRLHRILRSDDARALHDHPWWSCSILLRGRYTEIVPVRQVQHPLLDRSVNQHFIRRPFRPVFRRANTRHRLEIEPGQAVWSLFIHGGRGRAWGFYPPQGWIAAGDYLRGQD